MSKQVSFKLYLCLSLVITFSIFGFNTNKIFASNTDGTIDSTSRYAYMESGSWIDFGNAQGNVHVTDTVLTGYAWSSEFGWISLNCSNDNSCANVDYKVSNDGNGILSGLAYGETIGWLNFKTPNSGVTINSSGEFSGYAWGDQTGWVSFNCSNTNTCDDVDYFVKTDWRPANSRASNTSVTTTLGSSGSSSGSRIWYYINPIINPIVHPIDTISNLGTKIISIFKPSTPKPQSPIAIEEIVKKTTPSSMNGKWSLFSSNKIGKFILAPLPESIASLTQKFPRLRETFKVVGIKRMSDLNKLSSAKFVLSGISKEAGISGGAGVPISSLTASQKKILPTNIVFAKAGNSIDYNIFLTINNAGEARQEINTIVGKPIELSVKADRPVTSIKGYLTLKDLKREQARKIIPVNSMLAAPIMAVIGLGQDLKKTDVVTENKMVLQEFTYNDENNDGIYTANITAPMVHGEYEIISILEYKDKTLGKKELRLTTVVDPEGYIYEQNGNKETRIPEAKVTLFMKNIKTGEFEIWPAKEYQQINPQKTDKSGTYSFLVPEGEYKITVSAPDYYDYSGEVFTVQEGRGIHENIPLKAKSWWRSLVGFIGF